MRSISLRALALVLVGGIASTSATGCFSADEGEALKKDVEQLKKIVSSEAGKADRERQQLQKVMEQATALLTRNSADVGAQVERLQTHNSKLLGQLEENQKAINDLNSKYAQLSAKVEVNTEANQANASAQQQQTPLDKDALYRSARAKLSAGDHIEARNLLRQFINRFAEDSRIDLTQRLLGDSYYQQQKFAAAIVEYRKIIEKRTSVASELAEALYKTGMSFYQLKFCSDSRSFLMQFTKRFRHHKDAGNARKLLKLIQRYRRNREFCTS